MSNIQRYPSEFEDLDFEVIEEHWNEYELEDNSRIKIRLVLKKMIGDPHNPNHIACDFAPVIFSVYTPISYRGELNNAPKPEEYETLPSYEVRIERANEKFNRYRILKKDIIVKTKLEVPEIKRITDRFDNDGIPFYVVYNMPHFLIMDSKNKIQP